MTPVIMSVGTAMHVRTTAASLPPLNTDCCCADDVDDASGIKSDVNGSRVEGSDCPIDWAVLLETLEPSALVEALPSLEVSPVCTLKEKISTG